ncbi:MAG: ABC transporter ATP-binding protein [Candidatus Hodarchaeales archaeon]|jgi:ABC-2 type transport system ATP-binding protein
MNNSKQFSAEKSNLSSNNENDVLTVHGLKKYFESVHAVDDLTFNIRKGEIYGLLGPNGAGKTTAIKSILGLLSLNGGKITVLGDLDPIDSPEKVKEKIGYVAEEAELYESMTVKELFDFIASIRRLEPEKATNNAREYLISLDAMKYYNTFIGGLSRGNKQKIQIIAALIHEPEILILDEPLSGLDARSARVLKEIFQIHVERGGSIILSTHIMEQAQTLCDRIGIINQGKMVAEGTFEELQSFAKAAGATLEEIFLRLTGQAESANGIIEKLRELSIQKD